MTTTARRGPGRPPASKSNETRLRIIGAAREVFSEVGYSAATFQAIAKRSDLTRPAVNHYFGDKRALYRETVTATVDTAYRLGLARATAEPTLTAKLAAFAAGANEAGPRTAALLVTTIHEARHHPELRDEGRACEGIARRFVEWAIADAVERGEVQPEADDGELAESLMAMLFGFHFYVGYLGSAALLTRAIPGSST